MFNPVHTLSLPVVTNQDVILGHASSVSHIAVGATSGPRLPCVPWDELVSGKSLFHMKGSTDLVHIHNAAHGDDNAEKLHDCSYCKKTFFCASYLSQHLLIHLDIRRFGPCKYCGKKFIQLSHLQQHLRAHTGEKPYKCPIRECGKRFSQLSNLQNHSRHHEIDKPFKCKSCYKCFASERLLQEHAPSHIQRLRHHRNNICHYCGKSYAVATFLTKHLEEHRWMLSIDRNDVCNRFGQPLQECDVNWRIITFYTTSSEVLSKVIRSKTWIKTGHRMLQGVDARTQEAGYREPILDHTSDWSGIAMGARSGPRLPCIPWSELVAGKTLPNTQNRISVQKYTRNVNIIDKNHKCPKCHKMFSTGTYLTQHVRSHLQIRLFGPCGFCGKKFIQLSHLKQHIRTHTGEKPYKCPVFGCGKEFAQLSNLQHHSRCHKDKKPLK